MAEVTVVVRKKVSKAACRVEEVIHQLWSFEAKLTAAAASSPDPGAEDLASRIACICVDHLHPAVESMREAGKPRRRTETE
jgi:hypothetical protein